MARVYQLVPISGTGDFLLVLAGTAGALTGGIEPALISDPDNPDLVAKVAGSDPGSSDAGLVVRVIPSATPTPVSGPATDAQMRATPLAVWDELGIFTKPFNGLSDFVYDANSNMTSVTTRLAGVAQQVGTFTYDSKNRMTSAVAV